MTDNPSVTRIYTRTDYQTNQKILAQVRQDALSVSSINRAIDKKDKDHSILNNWRPNSLLNTDVKILSKILEFRIKKILPNIIHHNQSDNVEGRYIGETIRTIYDIMEFTKNESISGILAFLDFEKAFDSIEWNFISRCLEFFVFGADFRKWVSILNS